MSDNAQNLDLEMIDNLVEVDPSEFLLAMKPKEHFIIFDKKKTRLIAPNGYDFFDLINRFPQLQEITANTYDKIKNYITDPNSDLSDAGITAF